MGEQPGVPMVAVGIAAQQREITNLPELAQSVAGFYNTENEEARRELQAMLNRFQSRPECWRLTMELVKPENSFPPVVQFYGAKALYDSIVGRFDVLVESTESTDTLKAFLVRSLFTGGRAYVHSVLNKLSSALAVFMLKCTPDIWPKAFKEVIDTWGQEQPELVLRVLAEVAAEYTKLAATSLRQYRGPLRVELSKVSSDVIRLVRDALVEPTAPASLKNAAVECVEMWLKLPGMKLEDFMAVFTHVFNNISSDVGAMARVLSTLRANEEMSKFPQFVQQISSYLASSVCPMLVAELNNVLASPDSEEQLTELAPLIVATAEFSQEFLGQILTNAASSFGDVAIRDQSHASIYVVLCEFFLHISTVKGIYPTQESISDLAEPFWCELKEQLAHIDGNKPYAGNKRLICADSAKYFLQLLSSAIDKIAYFPDAEKLLGRAELERFEAYRITRGDVASNAMQLAPLETGTLLANSLNAYLTQRDIHHSEATLYYVKEAGNMFKEKNFAPLLPVLCSCAAPIQWGVAPGDLKRYAITLLKLLQKTEHLLLTSDGAREFLPSITNIVLAFLNYPDVDAEALETLTALLRHRDPAVQVILDPIITACFAYFSTKEKPEEARLMAIRCVGIGLSFRSIDFIRESLDKIIAPSFIAMQSAIASNGTQRQKEAVLLFELSVVEKLVGTLESNQRNPDDVASQPAPDAPPTPVLLIMEECLKLFNSVFSGGAFSTELVVKICDVLRAGATSLYIAMAPLLPSYMFYLDNLLFHYPGPACAVAKAMFLTFRQSNEATPFLVKKLSEWFTQQAKKYGSGAPFTIGDQEEHMQEFGYQVVKKNWASLVSAVSMSEESATEVERFLQSLLYICVNVIAHGREASMIRESFHTILLVLKNCMAIDKAPLRRAVEQAAEQTITVVFQSINSELVSMQTPQIAEILFLFAKNYASQTRTMMARLPGGNSPAVAEMFAQLTVKNFRQRVGNMHQAAMRAKGMMGEKGP